MCAQQLAAILLDPLWLAALPLNPHESPGKWHVSLMIPGFDKLQAAIPLIPHEWP